MQHKPQLSPPPQMQHQIANANTRRSLSMAWNLEDRRGGRSFVGWAGDGVDRRLCSRLEAGLLPETEDLNLRARSRIPIFCIFSMFSRILSSLHLSYSRGVPLSPSHSPLRRPATHAGGGVASAATIPSLFGSERISTVRARVLTIPPLPLRSSSPSKPSRTLSLSLSRRPDWRRERRKERGRERERRAPPSVIPTVDSMRPKW